MTVEPQHSKAVAAMEYTRQAKKFSYTMPHQTEPRLQNTAVEAKFITPQDPVVVTASGGRLPVIPLEGAKTLNRLKNEVEGHNAAPESPALKSAEVAADDDLAEDERRRGSSKHGGARAQGTKAGSRARIKSYTDASAPLRGAIPPSRTTPLFPPIPLYGPPGYILRVQSICFRVTSFFLSLAFLGIIVLGSIATSLPALITECFARLMGKDPDTHRPFYEEEVRRKNARQQANRMWRDRSEGSSNRMGSVDANKEGSSDHNAEFEPIEGGPDPIICDVGHYARRVGLDVEEYEVQTEDGFLITLWHIYNPKEYIPASATHRRHRGPDVFFSAGKEAEGHRPNGYGHIRSQERKSKYPVLMMHGLLQSAGAYCCTDDNSLAFFLCKRYDLQSAALASPVVCPLTWRSGFDIWLGENRCGFRPRHTILKPSEPRMWAWNIRQMGVMDLPAFVSRVLAETGFEKLALISHSQGTTQTFVALAKEQRPELGQKISVFCALAPAVYAGPLISKAYFKFMRIISPALFRLLFGIHAFIPFMMTMHSLLPARIYGVLGYRVFSFLFDWTDTRWERDLRDRMFQFAPTYVSAESMRWWLGKDCFAKHKCVLATRDESKQEAKEDEENDLVGNSTAAVNGTLRIPRQTLGNDIHMTSTDEATRWPSQVKAWYDDRVPPFALWVAGSDDLVDGRRLLRRFERGREPHVRVVHSRIIDEYEHLDVIWAMDAIDKVGREIRDVIWRTMPQVYRDLCLIPRSCSSHANLSLLT